MENSYCELRNKEVVNVLNGKRLGRIVDLIISSRSCRVLGLVVPGCKKFFKTKDDIFIPWKNIQRIGDDVILVQLQDGLAGESASSGYDAPPPVVHERYAEDDE